MEVHVIYDNDVFIFYVITIFVVEIEKVQVYRQFNNNAVSIYEIYTV